MSEEEKKTEAALVVTDEGITTREHARIIITPTEDRLKEDAASIAQQIHDSWHGDVECVVILCPKDSGTAQWAGTFKSAAKQRHLLNAVIKATPLMHKINRKRS